jgi:hypothetical protein
VCYLSSVYYLVMKLYIKLFHVNPLGRDIVILITLGMLIAGALVTASLILINQF